MAATLFSRPTPRGTTSFGKTTASRSGTRGRSFGNWLVCEVVLVFVVSGSVTSSFLLALRGSSWNFLELNALLTLASSGSSSRRFVRHFDRLECLCVLTRELVRDLIQQVCRVAELEQ